MLIEMGSIKPGAAIQRVVARIAAQGIVSRITGNRVIASAAIKAIIAILALQCVISCVTPDRVCPAAPNHSVVSRSTDDGEIRQEVIAHGNSVTKSSQFIALENSRIPVVIGKIIEPEAENPVGIGRCSELQRVIAAVICDDVGTSSENVTVIANAQVDCIEAIGKAVERVIATAAENDVCVFMAPEIIIAFATIESVVAATTQQEVVARVACQAVVS